VRFTLEQRFDAAPDAVAAAYADPDLYASFADLPRAGRPEVLHHEVDEGTVHLDVRWRFTAPLSSAARAVIDPDRLIWVERSAHDLADRTVTWRLLPENYADRFTCHGTYHFDDDDRGGTVRRSEGELKVKAPLVARAVEGAILDGLREQLAAEVPLVERYLKR
jgi:hypothetical protein